MAQPIKEWPESDRPREKLLEKGAQTLSKAELLAIILRTGEASTGQSALDHGRDLINRFDNSFRRLEEASIQDLRAIKGIGPAKAAQIKAALEIAKRFAQEELKPGDQFRSSRDVFNHFRERFGRTIHDGHFQVVDFDVRVVDAATAQCREQVLDGREHHSGPHQGCRIAAMRD